MKARLAVYCLIFAPTIASAGGLLLPGSGAISTSRAGAAVASADDGEALSLNPAGIAKAKGTTITVSAALVSYAMEFQRRGTYDAIADADVPYEGQPFPLVKNDPKPPLGIGSYQPLPVIAVVTDLGGRLPNVHLAAGLYAPNAYPFRDMSNGYVFNGDPNAPPPPSRYDIVKQEAAVILPSVAASYSITPQIDIGARLSIGFAELKSTTVIWGVPANYDEYVARDGIFTADAKDGFVPAYGFGVTYRPTPAIEIGANFNSSIGIDAVGDATSENGSAVNLNGNPIVIRPPADANARCATGGSNEAQKVCVSLAIPLTAQIGARYKFLTPDGAERGDIELDVGYENWGAGEGGQYRVVADADIYVVAGGMETFALSLKDNEVNHRFKDVYNVRLGGSYRIPQGVTNNIIVRGGLGYDTRAATDGWLRADIDGAARTTVTLGAAYRTKRWEVNVGGGAILEGTNTNPGMCNPTNAQMGCVGDGTENPVTDRAGPDPINPILVPETQLESPVAQGDYKSHYTLVMLGFSTWF
jgi:long-subunit fatty acid transport protein